MLLVVIYHSFQKSDTIDAFLLGFFVSFYFSLNLIDSFLCISFSMAFIFAGKFVQLV